MRAVEQLRFEFLRRRVSWTRPRVEVCAALARVGPCSIGALVDQLEELVSRRTVYDTVRLFLDFGVAVRASDGLVELAPPFRQHSHHFWCRMCGVNYQI